MRGRCTLPTAEPGVVVEFNVIQCLKVMQYDVIK